MSRYIDADSLLKKIWYDNSDSIVLRSYAAELVKAMPTADVVPKSEVERLTINMNAYGLTAKRLAEENESLEIELENMRRNLGDAREGWNDAECEAERLRKALDEYEETSGLKQAKAEVAREIFEEIDEIIFGTIIPNDCAIISIAKLAELKKKYTQN